VGQAAVVFSYSRIQTAQLCTRYQDRGLRRTVMTGDLLIMPESAKHIADGVMLSNRTPCVSKVMTQFALSVCNIAIRSSPSKASKYYLTRAVCSLCIMRYALQFREGQEGVRRFLHRPAQGRPTRLLPSALETRGVHSATRIFRAAGLR
jgi:hypothetical protein